MTSKIAADEQAEEGLWTCPSLASTTSTWMAVSAPEQKEKAAATTSISREPEPLLPVDVVVLRLEVEDQNFPQNLFNFCIAGMAANVEGNTGVWRTC